ncbi:MAG: potassium channel family protein [Planctomycetota bacterium]|jgi:voltage-gated potassium channel
MNHQIRKRIRFSIYLIIAVFLTGSVGFHLLLERPFIECLYLTVVMLTTVGFGDISPLGNMPTDGNKYIILTYTIILIIFGMSIFLYTIGIITEYIVSGDMIKSRRRRHMQKRISLLKNHYIICGAGETGMYMMDELLKTDRSFIVIEKSEERIKTLLNRFRNLHYIIGDATEDINYDHASLCKSAGVILTLPDEKDNLFCLLSIMQKKEDCMNNLKIAAKVNNWEKTAPKMEKAGADVVISAHFISARRMVSEMFRPSLTTFLDRMLRDKSTIMRIEEVTLSPASPLLNLTLESSQIRQQTGLDIIAIKKFSNSEYVYVPKTDTLMEEGDVLISIGNMEQIKKLRKLSGES